MTFIISKQDLGNAILMIDCMFIVKKQIESSSNNSIF